MDLRQRYRGALLGLAAGDALGTTLEFQRPGTFEPITDMVGGGPWSLRPGEWTDDTSMALCLAESLVEQQGFNAVDQLERYVRWWRTGHLGSNGYCVDIGITVSTALRKFESSNEPYCGSADPRSAGNGCIMRLAPVPLFFAASASEALERCADSSRTTHATQACVDAARYFGGLLVGTLNGVPKNTLLSERYSPATDHFDQPPLSPEIDEIARGSYKAKKPPDIRGTGYVVESLEAALWAFWQTETYEEGALLAVNLGNDADTTGAVYGQLAGAFYGETAIPERWRDKLAKRELIVGFADRLLEARLSRQSA